MCEAIASAAGLVPRTRFKPDVAKLLRNPPQHPLASH